MKRLPFFGRLLLDWLLTVMGVLGAMLCLLSAFELPLPGDLIPGVLLASGLCCGLLSGKKLRRFSVPALLALFVLLCWIFHTSLGESFRQLWGVLISRFSLGYDRLLDLAPREKPEIEAVGPALSCLSLAMAIAVSCAVRWWQRSFPAALAMVPAAAAGSGSLCADPGLQPAGAPPGSRRGMQGHLPGGPAERRDPGPAADPLPPGKLFAAHLLE